MPSLRLLLHGAVVARPHLRLLLLVLLPRPRRVGRCVHSLTFSDTFFLLSMCALAGFVCLLSGFSYMELSPHLQLLLLVFLPRPRRVGWCAHLRFFPMFSLFSMPNYVRPCVCTGRRIGVLLWIRGRGWDGVCGRCARAGVVWCGVVKSPSTRTSGTYASRKCALSTPHTPLGVQMWLTVCAGHSSENMLTLVAACAFERFLLSSRLHFRMPIGRL